MISRLMKCVLNERFKAKSKNAGNMIEILVASHLVYFANASEQGLSGHLNSSEKVAHSVDCGAV
jgi:hypothetical protein